jgi:WD40 repeat protein
MAGDGARVPSGSGDDTAKLWDAAVGALIRTFGGHSGEVYSVAFAANGISSARKVGSYLEIHLP